LLIVFGESWTYGDSLHPYVKCVDRIDNLPYRLSNNFSGKVANYLNADLLLCAQPGNSNINYWTELNNFLQKFNNIDHGYKKIYLIVQMTSPGRDYKFDRVEKKVEHLFCTQENIFPTLDWNEWLIKYDLVYLDWLSSMLKEFNIDRTVLWKNFNEFHVKDLSSYAFETVRTPFHRYACEMSGQKVEVADILEMTFYENIEKIKSINFNKEILDNQLLKIENGWKALSKSMLNNFHPSENGHWVLSTLFINKLVDV
jgi:hypothetical protein